MDSKKNQFESFMNAIGSLAEVGAILRDELLKNHFTRDEACKIVSNILSTILISGAK